MKKDIKPKLKNYEVRWNTKYKPFTVSAEDPTDAVLDFLDFILWSGMVGKEYISDKDWGLCNRYCVDGRDTVAYIWIKEEPNKSEYICSIRSFSNTRNIKDVRVKEC